MWQSSSNLFIVQQFLQISDEYYIKSQVKFVDIGTTVIKDSHQEKM